MSRMRKVYKRYERWVLLGLVVFLLAIFSVPATCEGPVNQRGSYFLGGSYNVSPSERAELSDSEFDRVAGRYTNFQNALRMPTREFRQFVMGMKPDEAFKAAWSHQLAYDAGVHAGYRAGPRQTTTALEDLVGFALMFRSRLPFSDVNYQKFLAENYKGSPADFREAVEQVVIKDQFLYPIITAARYQVTYPEAYEAWKQERERVDLETIALPAEPFAELVRKEESTRGVLGEQEELLRRVVSTAASVRRVDAKVESVKSQAGSYPEKLSDIAGFNPAKDPWGGELRYTLVDGKPDVRSAGPDEAFDTADDITLETQRQLDTHANLYELGGKFKQRRIAAGVWPKSMEELKKGSESDRLPPLTRDINDGWDQPFIYTPGADDKADPTLASVGPDGQAGTADDLKVTLNAEEIVVSPGPGLAAFVRGDLKDPWGNDLRIDLRRAQPPTWRVTSAGADGDFAAADDNVVSGNDRELRAFFSGMRSDFIEPAKREFETLFVHLPLVSDAAMKRLWDAFPQYRPTDETKLFEEWRAYRGDVFYKAENPADAENGHGAQHARDVAPGATATLVPSKDVFPSELSKPEAKDEPAKDDAEPKKDDEEPKKDDEPAGDDPDADDRKEFNEKGWREILIRQKFFESLLNDVLTRVRTSATEAKTSAAALERWEKTKADVEAKQKAWDEAWKGKEAEASEPRPADFTDEKPAVTEELTLEGVLKAEFAELAASGVDGTPAALQYWKTPKPMTREEYEANANFGTGLQFELNRLAADGDYNNVPAQLATRLTKVLVRRLAYEPERQLEYDEVKDKVFDRWVQRRQMARAAERLAELKTEIEKAEADAGADTPEAKKKAADEALAAWSKKHGVEPLIERTGLFIGNVPPPAVPVTDDMDEATKAATERRNFIWRQGYGTVRAVEARQDTTSAEPGTFGRNVLQDPKIDDKGTGYAYLVRVADRVFPSKHEFSPRRYTEQLSKEVFGARESYTQFLRDQDGKLRQSLARWFDDMEWMQAKFDLQTNSELNVLEERKRR